MVGKRDFWRLKLELASGYGRVLPLVVRTRRTSEEKQNNSNNEPMKPRTRNGAPEFWSIGGEGSRGGGAHGVRALLSKAGRRRAGSRVQPGEGGRELDKIVDSARLKAPPPALAHLRPPSPTSIFFAKGSQPERDSEIRSQESAPTQDVGVRADAQSGEGEILRENYGFYRLRAGSIRLFPHDSTQVVDFPRICDARFFSEEGFHHRDAEAQRHTAKRGGFGRSKLSTKLCGNVAGFYAFFRAFSQFYAQIKAVFTRFYAFLRVRPIFPARKS